MASDPYIYPTLRDLTSEIGQVQVYWSFLEAEMRRQLAETEDARSSKVPIVFRWRSASATVESSFRSRLLVELDRIAGARNLLAHGINSTSANPWKENSAFVECVAADGSKHRFTLDEIRTLAEDIDRFRLAIRC
jgi:uncharacterized protein (UPF0216 family)